MCTLIQVKSIYRKQTIVTRKIVEELSGNLKPNDENKP